MHERGSMRAATDRLVAVLELAGTVAKPDAPPLVLAGERRRHDSEQAIAPRRDREPVPPVRTGRGGAEGLPTGRTRRSELQLHPLTAVRLTGDGHPLPEAGSGRRDLHLNRALGISLAGGERDSTAGDGDHGRGRAESNRARGAQHRIGPHRRSSFATSTAVPTRLADGLAAVDVSASALGPGRYAPPTAIAVRTIRPGPRRGTAAGSGSPVPPAPCRGTRQVD